MPAPSLAGWVLSKLMGALSAWDEAMSRANDEISDDCQHLDQWWSRTLCTCDSMHYYCTACGEQLDACDE
jgi:hypothetical protein